MSIQNVLPKSSKMRSFGHCFWRGMIELVNQGYLKNFHLQMKFSYFTLWVIKVFCVEFQRIPSMFHTRYLTHTLKDVLETSPTLVENMTLCQGDWQIWQNGELTQMRTELFLHALKRMAIYWSDKKSNDICGNHAHHIYFLLVLSLTMTG